MIEFLPLRTRLFRVGSLSDLLYASIIADLLPAGRHILATAFKTEAGSDAYRESFRDLSDLHPWHRIVDLSDVPMTVQVGADETLLNRFRRDCLLRTSIQQLRTRVAEGLGLDPARDDVKDRVNDAIDELYVTSSHRQDVLALCKVLSRARKIELPSTSDDLTRQESGQSPASYDPRAVPLRSLAFDGIRKTLWGDDAVPLSFVKIDAVYSFAVPASSIPEFNQLQGYVNEAVMSEYFLRLPEPVQGYYRRLADRCGNGVGVMLLNSERVPRSASDEDDDHRLMTEHLAECGAEAILVKPHPGSSNESTLQRVVSLRNQFPDLNIVPILRYHHYPIELVLAPFRAVACAWRGVSSLAILNLIYGIDTWGTNQLARRVARDGLKANSPETGWGDE